MYWDLEFGLEFGLDLKRWTGRKHWETWWIKKTWELKHGLPSVPSQELPNLLHLPSTLMTSCVKIISQSVDCHHFSCLLTRSLNLPWIPITQRQSCGVLQRRSDLLLLQLHQTLAPCTVDPRGPLSPTLLGLPVSPSSWKVYPHPSPRSTLTPGFPILRLLALLSMSAPCPSVHCATYPAGSLSSLRTMVFLSRAWQDKEPVPQLL